MTIDCADPAALATFWAAVLGYAPPDSDSIHAALRALGHREEDLGNWYRIVDPAGQGPRLAFQRVPPDNLRHALEPITSSSRLAH